MLLSAWKISIVANANIRLGSTLFEPLTLCSPVDDCRVLSKQSGAIFIGLGGSLISKSGNRVRHNEEVAMRLVKQYTDVPIPDIILSAYNSHGGFLGMIIIPSSPLHLL